MRARWWWLVLFVPLIAFGGRWAILSGRRVVHLMPVAAVEGRPVSMADVETAVAILETRLDGRGHVTEASLDRVTVELRRPPASERELAFLVARGHLQFLLVSDRYRPVDYARPSDGWQHADSGDAAAWPEVREASTDVLEQTGRMPLYIPQAGRSGNWAVVYTFVTPVKQTAEIGRAHV